MTIYGHKHNVETDKQETFEYKGIALQELLDDQEKYNQEIAIQAAEAEAKATAKAALLDRLGITEDEAKLLLS